MAKSRTKLQGMSLARSMSRVRIRSPSLRSKSISDSFEMDQKIEFLGLGEEDFGNNECGMESNKVMVVVDSSLEAMAALEWALSHTLQSQDTLVLLHVAKPSRKERKSKGKLNLRAYELLHSMKNMIQMKKPGVEVEISILEGKEKGPIIVEQAKLQKVSLLVLGQRKKYSVMWRLIKRWAGKRNAGEFVNYCIQNATCMAIAVRRKSSKLGGYLITTKRHKNFWLLA